MIRKGTGDVTLIYRGTEPVKKIYKGTILLWEGIVALTTVLPDNRILTDNTKMA